MLGHRYRLLELLLRYLASLLHQLVGRQRLLVIVTYRSATMFVGRPVFWTVWWMRHCIDTSPFVALVWATHGLSVVRASVYRGCPCWDPLGCPPMPRQDSIGSRAPTLCGCAVLVVVDIAHTRILQTVFTAVIEMSAFAKTFLKQSAKQFGVGV